MYVAEDVTVCDNTCSRFFYRRQRWRLLEAMYITCFPSLNPRSQILSRSPGVCIYFGIGISHAQHARWCVLFPISAFAMDAVHFCTVMGVRTGLAEMGSRASVGACGALLLEPSHWDG